MIGIISKKVKFDMQLRSQPNNSSNECYPESSHLKRVRNGNSKYIDINKVILSPGSSPQPVTRGLRQLVATNHPSNVQFRQLNEDYDQSIATVQITSSNQAQVITSFKTKRERISF